ncbi:MAG: 2-oxoacid:acceptor oxidoreductase family protein [Alphaproteobacteria bacterium]
MTDTARPVTLLIAALGGEGGGVLTDWIVSAAEASGLPVQSTSIPGVAQRTGATTYYIEIFPTPLAQLGGKRPVLALAPGVGDVDLVVASELLEAGRAIANGFVTADRTLLIASVSRVYLTVEKMQMGDGRYDSERLLKATEQNAKQRILFDMETAAKQAGAIVNAVMLGAIGGLGPAAGAGRSLRGSDQARWQGGRREPARFPRWICRGARAVASIAAALGQAQCEADARCARGGGLCAGGTRARNRHRGHPPPRRLSERRLRAALSRSSETDHRAKAPRRDRAPSRGAHVVRGRDPRRRGEDFARALPPYRRARSAPRISPTSSRNS